MTRYSILLFGILATFLIAMFGLTILPKLFIDEGVKTPEYFTSFEVVEGHRVFVREGCIYCHSKQVRPEGFGADFERGWGRASRPTDYRNLMPHNLGTMRTGPDLANIGARQPGEDWHYLNLFQPRAINSESIMPSFPWLFETVSEEARPGQEGLSLPEQYRVPGQKILPTEEARYLVAYLLSLDQQVTGVDDG